VRTGPSRWPEGQELTTAGSQRTGFIRRWGGWERELARRHRWRYGLYRSLQYTVVYVVIQVILNLLDHRIDTVELVLLGASILILGTPLAATLGRWIYLGHDREGDGGRSTQPGPADPLT